MNGVKMYSGANESIDTVYPWMKVIAIRNGLSESVVLRVWQYGTGSIKNLKAKPGTSAAQFVTPGGILTEKGQILIQELNTERANYISQMA